MGLLLRVALVSLCAMGAFAQTTALNFRPIDTEYSKSLDRLIAVSANPNRLHIYDAATGTDIPVPLALAPTAVSVGPSGLYAAVGHDAKVSYVNLVSARFEREFSIATTVRYLVLAGNFVHVMPNLSINLTTGAQTTASNVYSGGFGARLHPGGAAIYGNQDATYSNSIHRFDVSTGPLTGDRTGTYRNDRALCGEVWFSEDGKRIFTACSGVLTYDENPEKDMGYGGSLEGRLPVQWMALSGAAGRIAVIPADQSYWSGQDRPSDSEVRFYDYTWMTISGRAPLPDFDVAGGKFKSHGKWAFYNTAGTALYVVMQADSASGLLNDFAIQTISTNPLPGCTWSLDGASATASAYGGSASVSITAGAHCLYRAVPSAAWIRIASGGYGAGNSTLSYLLSANTTGASRTGAISLGGQTFSITQPPVTTPASDPLYRLSFKPLDAEYSKLTGKLVFASANPPELHIVDPATRADTLVSLKLAPGSVSVSRSSAYAAVGHDGWISYVNLTTGLIEKQFRVPLAVNDVVLAGNYIYAFSTNSWGELTTVNITTGDVSSMSWIYNGIQRTLDASGKFIYTEEGVKIDISAGTPIAPNSRNYSFSSCGKLWTTEDGQRIITKCGSVYRSSESPQEDLNYNGKLSPESMITAADYSSVQRLMAVIPDPNPNGGSGKTTDRLLRVFNYDYLTLNGELSLPQFPGGTKASFGRYLFWSSDAQRLYVIMQADTAENLASDYAMWTVSPDAPQTGCSVGLSQSSGSVAATGGSGELTVTSGTSCTWKGVSSASWLTLDGGTFGFGSGSIRYTAAPNLTTAARTASITAGSAVFTLTQAAGSPNLCTFSVGSPVLVTPATGVPVNVTLTAQGTNCAWTASSNVPWAQVYPLSGTGSQNFAVTVYPNFTTASRGGRITVAGHSVDITQAANEGTPGERFVRFLYFNHFGRQPSTNEVYSHLGAGLPRGELAINFLTSAEFNMGGRYVAGLYNGLLNRDAEFGGWLFQRNAMVTGSIPPLALVGNFLNSDEYRSKFGTPSNAEFVRLLYRYILLREAGQAEIDFQSGALRSISRPQLASNFLNSTEFRIGVGPRLTAFLLYATLLSRGPSTTELTTIETQLKAGVSTRALADSILSSTEFSQTLP